MSTRPTVALSAAQIGSVVQRLATEIDADHPDGVTIVGILKGSVILVADLVRAMTVPCVVDFLSLSSYSPGARRVRILKDLDRDVTGEDVVIAADVVDTGLSMRYAVDLVEARGARTVSVCALLDRPSRRILSVPLTYRGFETPDDFVVGYGLDFAERYRNLPSILPVEPEMLANERELFESFAFGADGAFPQRDGRE
jgi:hypoxanthine phosphoribosyltransferase